MTFNASDLEDALENYGLDEDGEPLEDNDDISEGGWEEIAWYRDGTGPFDVKVGDETVSVEVKEISTGTYEDDTYIVLEAEGRTFRKFGWTASHDGTYWEGSFNEVRPVEKTITVWETV